MVLDLPYLFLLSYLENKQSFRHARWPEGVITFRSRWPVAIVPDLYQTFTASPIATKILSNYRDPTPAIMNDHSHCNSTTRHGRNETRLQVEVSWPKQDRT